MEDCEGIWIFFVFQDHPNLNFYNMGQKEIHRVFTLYTNFVSFFRSIVSEWLLSSSPMKKIRLIGWIFDLENIWCRHVSLGWWIYTKSEWMKYSTSIHHNLWPIWFQNGSKEKNRPNQYFFRRKGSIMYLNRYVWQNEWRKVTVKRK